MATFPKPSKRSAHSVTGHVIQTLHAFESLAGNHCAHTAHAPLRRCRSANNYRGRRAKMSTTLRYSPTIAYPSERAFQHGQRKCVRLWGQAGTSPCVADAGIGQPRAKNDCDRTGGWPLCKYLGGLPASTELPVLWLTAHRRHLGMRTIKEQTCHLGIFPPR